MVSATAINLSQLRGHILKHCPELECYNCGGHGHMSRDCVGERVCSLCHQTGHLKRKCRYLGSGSAPTRRPSQVVKVVNEEANVEKPASYASKVAGAPQNRVKITVLDAKKSEGNGEKTIGDATAPGEEIVEAIEEMTTLIDEYWDNLGDGSAMTDLFKEGVDPRKRKQQEGPSEAPKVPKR